MLCNKFLYNSKDPHTDRFVWMFNQKILQFNLQECKKFMIILVVENGWCLYEIGLNAKTVYVMDPMMASSTQCKMERKHMKTSRLMLHCFNKCLHELYPDWHFATYPWTYKYNLGSTRTAAVLTADSMCCTTSRSLMV